MMNTFKYLLLNTLYEAKSHKVVLACILLVTFFIWLLGVHIDLVWENGQIIEANNSIWFGGDNEDYKLGFYFAYLLILLIIIFFITGIVFEGMQSSSLSLWLVKPLSRKTLLTFQLLSSTLLIWFLFVYFHIGLWLCLGIRYGVWLSGLWASLGIILLISLVLSCMVFFFSLVAGRSTSATFFCLSFVILIPLVTPLLENNFNFTMGAGRILLSFLEAFSPKLLDQCFEAASIVLDLSPDLSNLSQSLLFGAVTYGGSLYLFESRSV